MAVFRLVVVVVVVVVGGCASTSRLLSNDLRVTKETTTGG